MYARTTFSLSSENVNVLKDIAKKKQIKSLSRFVDDILGDYLERYQQQQKIKKMTKHYKQYSEQFNHSEFSELEEGMLSDLN